MIHTFVTISIYTNCLPILLDVFVEFKESSYSVVEDDSMFNVTLVKQGNPMQDILVFIIPVPGTAKCK